MLVKSNNRKTRENSPHTLPLPTSLFWSRIRQAFSSALADLINPADLELLDSVITEEIVSDNNENENEKKNGNGNGNDNENENKNKNKESMKV